MKKNNIYLFSFFLFFIDFISKIIVVNCLEYGKSIIIIPNFFSLTYVKNTGGAFSILDGNIFLLSIIGIIILFYFIFYIRNNNISKINGICTSLILGGLIGNLYDRIVNNGVIDFLDFIIFKYDFPIFNISDIFIVCGIILMILLEFGGKKNESR